MTLLAYWITLPLAIVGWIAIVFLVMRLCPQETARRELFTAGEDC